MADHPAGVPAAPTAPADETERPTVPLPPSQLVRLSLYWLGLSTIFSGLHAILGGRIQYGGLGERGAEGQSLIDPQVTARVLDRIRNQNSGDENTQRLTEQERKILELIGEGMTNRQIAERMYLAEKTVKNYVSNLLSKLGMERRTEAAVFAVRLQDERAKGTVAPG